MIWWIDQWMQGRINDVMTYGSGCRTGLRGWRGCAGWYAGTAQRASKDVQAE